MDGEDPEDGEPCGRGDGGSLSEDVGNPRVRGKRRGRSWRKPGTGTPRAVL